MKMDQFPIYVPVYVTELPQIQISLSHKKINIK